MEKLKISAKEVLDDIHSGMPDEELRSRHSLSKHQLQSLFSKLVDAGLIAQSELDNRGSIELAEEASWTCPACGEPQEMEFDKCPECGVDVAAFKARQVISSWEPSEGLGSLIKDLQGAGALKEGPGSDQRAKPPAAASTGLVTECPACGKVQPKPFDECPVCGIVVIRYLEQQRQRDAGSERKFDPIKAIVPDNQEEKTTPETVAGTSPEGLAHLSAIADVLPKRATLASALRKIGSDMREKVAEPAAGRESRKTVQSERTTVAGDLRTVGKYFTYFGLGMAAVGILGGLVQLILGYGAFSFIILGYSVLLIVIGGPIWLMCGGIAEAIEVSEEISDKLDENRSLLKQLLMKIDREK